MPGPYVVPVHGDADLPREVDVVVIGGGIIGCSTRFGTGRKRASRGAVRKGRHRQRTVQPQLGLGRISRRDPREVPLMAEALRIWPGLDAAHRPRYRLSARRHRLHLRDRPAICPPRTMEPQPGRLSARQPDDFRQGVPGSCSRARTLDLKGALYTAADGRAEPQKAAPAIAEAARDRGAHVLTECAVRGIETSAGAVSGVVTERGPSPARRWCWPVVPGPTCSPATLGIDFPQLKVMNSVLRTKRRSRAGRSRRSGMTTLPSRKRQDGGYTIASGHENITSASCRRASRSAMPAPSCRR
jgi:glycine/D-amino acid oxidase-like deaminating enzyme